MILLDLYYDSGEKNEVLFVQNCSNHLNFGNVSRISDAKLVILEFKYLTKNGRNKL